MATNTINYNYIKPGVNDPIDADRWGTQLNNNLDNLDIDLLKAQYGIGSFAVSTGAALDTYEITLNPPITTYTAGLTIAMLAHQSNVGSATLNVDGKGAKNIYKDINSPLGSSDIKQNQVIIVVYDGANFQLQSRANTAGSVITTEGDLIVGNSSGSQSRLPIGLIGQFLKSDGDTAVWDYISNFNYEVFTSDGTWTRPAGVEKVAVICIGGGGGGGGATSSSANTPALGGGGGGGGLSFGIYTPNSTEAITIGTGGAGGTASSTPNSGASGGTSNFGTFTSATGGAGGSKATTGTGKSGGNGGVGSSGIINSHGQKGGTGGQYESTTINTDSSFPEYRWNYKSGEGGGNPIFYNAFNGVIIADTNGTNGTSYGCGGSGGYASNSQKSGGNGSDGLVIVFW